MKLHSDSFANRQMIPGEFAFGLPGSGDLVPGGNRNPHLRWSDAPQGTQSFVVLCIDTDVPSRFEHANQVGHTLPEDMPRVDFTHWVMIDVPAHVTAIAAGSCSDGVVDGGKQSPAGPDGARQGRNDYGGDGPAWLGYDGPCPPFNDQRLHHYHFHVYALDVASLDVPDDFGVAEVRAAMDGRILASATLTGVYTRNPALA